MKKYIFLACFLITVFGCSKPDFKYYHSLLYPDNIIIKDWGESWERTAFFKNTPITIYVDSRIDVEDYPTIYQGQFEPVITNTAVLSLDKDIVLANTTLQAGTNLLETQHAKIEHNYNINDSTVICIE